MLSTGFSVLLLSPVPITFVFAHGFWFYFISTDEVLSINPSAKIFVCGDVNAHHKDWLTYSGGTDRPGKLCYNFSISNVLLGSKTVILSQSCPSGFIYFFWRRYLFCNGFLSIGKLWSCFCLSFHWLFIKFATGCPFHRIAYDYSPADWDDLRDYLRDVLWSIFLNSVFLLLLVNFVIDFRLELMYISLIESIRSSLTHLHGFQLLVLLP